MRQTRATDVELVLQNGSEIETATVDSFSVDYQTDRELRGCREPPQQIEHNFTVDIQPQIGHAMHDIFKRQYELLEACLMLAIFGMLMAGWQPPMSIDRQFCKLYDEKYEKIEN